MKAQLRTVITVTITLHDQSFFWEQRFETMHGMRSVYMLSFMFFVDDDYVIDAAICFVFL